MLANAGYGILQMNFRGSTGYGAAFEKAGRNQWGGVMINDVIDGAEVAVIQGLGRYESLVCGRCQFRWIRIHDECGERTQAVSVCGQPQRGQ